MISFCGGLIVNLGNGDGCTILNVRKTTEILTLQGWLLWYVSYFSIKLLLKNYVIQKLSR